MTLETTVALDDRRRILRDCWFGEVPERLSNGGSEVYHD
jgi:hypothetical protein